MTIKIEIQGDNAADVLGQMQAFLHGSGEVPQNIQSKSAMAQIDFDAATTPSDEIAPPPDAPVDDAEAERVALIDKLKAAGVSCRSNVTMETAQAKWDEYAAQRDAVTEDTPSGTSSEDTGVTMDDVMAAATDAITKGKETTKAMTAILVEMGALNSDGLPKVSALGENQWQEAVNRIRASTAALSSANEGVTV